MTKFKFKTRLDIGPQVVELVISVRKQKQMGGGAWGLTGLIMLQSTVMMSILGSYGGNMRCAREGCFFENVKMNQFKRAPQG